MLFCIDYMLLYVVSVMLYEIISFFLLSLWYSILFLC